MITINKIPSYSNENFLEKIKEYNFTIAQKEIGQFKYNAVFIDLNAVHYGPKGEKIALTCNFRCPGCFKFYEQKFHATDRLNLDEIKNVIDFAKDGGARAVVYAGLGEPMMDQDFWHVLDYAYKQKMKTVLFTNGTFTTESNAKILFRKKVIVIIKRNTLNDEKQDKMVGDIKGASKRMRKGLYYLIKAGFRYPRLAIDSVITNDNIDDLRDLLRFCRKNRITPYFEAFITKTLRENDYKNLILSQNKFDELFLDLQKIDRKEFGINTKLVQGMRVYGQNPCIKYWTMFSVRNNGDVALCVSDSEIIGNIRKQPLDEILSPKNKKIVKRYKSGCNCSMTTSEIVQNEKIKKLFGKFATAKYSYETHMKKTGHVLAQKKIISKFYNSISGRVLDIATGSGAIARLLAKNTNAKIYAVDFSKEMIQVAQKYAQKEKLKIYFSINDAQKLPFKDNFFDCVVCSFGFYWFYDVEKVLKEVKRVKKSNGVVILLEEHFRKGDPKPIFNKRGSYLEKLASLEKYIGISGIKNIMKKNQFILVKQAKEIIDDRHDIVGLLYKKH